MAAERARWLFVELDGKLVGQGSAAIYSDTYVAVGVSLMREARGMGLGKKMMLLVEDEARKLKRDTLYLHVWSTNPVARTLYKDLGYEEIARRRISSDWTPGSMRT
jgi:ribosomal protein S18 acetylase RimI-like enzyme